ncbi:ACBP-domain-containing protein [Serendipita vermifera]|nr:ACBP-domain-containing protein [Serendipita vermifera]
MEGVLKKIKDDNRSPETNNTRFNLAVMIVSALPKDGPIKPTVEDQLQFYACFKQGKDGDNNTAKPGIFELAAKQKWNAWNEYKGKPQEEVREEYVQKLIGMLDTTDDEIAKKLRAGLADDEAAEKLLAEIALL